MKLPKQNEKRAKLALSAVKHFSELPGNEPLSSRQILEQNVSDLLTNLAHLCDREGLSLARMLERAQRHYEAESAAKCQFRPLAPALADGESVELSDGNLARWEYQTEPRSLAQVAVLVCCDCGEQLDDETSVCECHC